MVEEGQILESLELDDVQEIATILVRADEKDELGDEDKIDLLLAYNYTRDSHPGLKDFARDIAVESAFRDGDFYLDFFTDRRKIKVGGALGGGLYLHSTGIDPDEIPKVSRYRPSTYSNFLEMGVEDVGLIAASAAAGLGFVGAWKYANMKYRGNLEEYLAEVNTDDVSEETNRKLEVLEEDYGVIVDEDPMYRRIFDRVRSCL